MLFPFLSTIKGILISKSFDKGMKIVKDLHKKNFNGAVSSNLEEKILSSMTDKSVFQSKKFWALVAGFIVPVLNHKFGLGLNSEHVVYLVMTYMGAQAVHDHGKGK